MGDKPVNYINWFGAARYINWLHNNKPSGAPGPNTTESGVYDLVNFIVQGTNKPSPNHRNSYWLPSEDEWYKAAIMILIKMVLGQDIGLMPHKLILYQIQPQ